MRRSRLLFLAVAVLVMAAVPHQASAHVHKPIDPSVCSIPWQTPAQAERLVRCISNYFGADTPVVLKIAECESGFDAVNPNPYSSADGLFQYLSSTWASHRAHHLPGVPSAQRTHGRYAAIVAVRYMVHTWRAGGWPYGPWESSRRCWGGTAD